MSKPILASFTVMGPLIWYVNAQVRMWIILDINYKHYYHLGKSQICAGAGDYFRTSKPHSEKLCTGTLYLDIGHRAYVLHNFLQFFSWVCSDAVEQRDGHDGGVAGGGRGGWCRKSIHRFHNRFLQSRRRPPLGPSPGWKRLLALSHLRHY